MAEEERMPKSQSQQSDFSQDPFQALVDRLGAAGLYITSEGASGVGSPVEFAITLPPDMTGGLENVTIQCQGRVVHAEEASSKSQTPTQSWEVQEGTGKEVGPWLEEKESDALAIVAEGEDPLVHAKFGALKNILPVIDAVVEERSQRKLKQLVEALTPDVSLSESQIAEAKMFTDAMRVILESRDFMKAQDIAHLAHFSQKNPSSQPNRWKRAGQIFAVSYKGNDLYPAYALDWKHGAKPLPVMRKVLEMFRDKDDWQKAFWFGSVNSYLKNKMPKELLQSHPEEVLKAAEFEASGVQHG